MVDEMTERPVGRVPGRPFPNIEPYNLKRNFCYRPAAGAAEPSPTGPTTSCKILKPAGAKGRGRIKPNMPDLK